MKGVNNVVSGTLWTAGGGAVQAIIQILRLSILARYLDKSDFGLVAIIVLILGLTHIFADLGTTVSLFSRKTVTRNEYSSLFWVSLSISVCLYGVLITISPLVSQFYAMPQLALLIPVMGLDLVISSVGRLHRVFLQKAMQFKTLAIIDAVSNILSLIVALFIALQGGGVWSLIYSTLFTSLTAAVLLLAIGLKNYPLSFYINLNEGKSFYKVGLYQTASQILDYAASQIDILIIGKIMGPSELGVYNLIKQLVIRVYSLLNPIIARVAIPVLAQLNDIPEQLKIRYLQMLKLTSLLNFAIYGFLALLATEVLGIMYGASYTDSAYILQIFCIWGAITSVMSSASSIVVVTGRTDLGFKWTIIRLLTNPLFVVIGYQFGFLGIVSAQAIYSLLFYSIYWKLVTNKIISTLSFHEYLYTTLPFLSYSLSLSLLLFNFKNSLINRIPSDWLTIIIWGGSYILLYCWLNKKLVLSLLKRKNTSSSY